MGSIFKGSACLTGFVAFTLEGGAETESLVSTLYQEGEGKFWILCEHGFGFALPSEEILQQTSPYQQKPKE